ncbi:hypothetical protein [Streptomyces sp. NPDC050988]|uniref:hypothetical protein n=1 Tax=Streptomyces sp. NPDC050988 TaxID=3365637 RepID=UPI0037B75CE7
MATSLQTTVYNAGIAAGSLTGGLVLAGPGAGTLPWTTFLLVTLTLAIVAAGRRHAFPSRRRTELSTVGPRSTGGRVRHGG